MKIMRIIKTITIILTIILQPIHPEQINPTPQKNAIKNWNFMVYIASNNDLHEYSIQNLKQMQKIGSNKNINIIAQQDTYGKREISRYFVEKDKLILKEIKKNSDESTSGTSISLYKFVEWAIKNYPAKKNILVLWNHGSGIEDPSIWNNKILKYPGDFFEINKETGLIELNRKIIDLKDPKGIAFNEFFETYLTNQDIRNTLSDISKNLLDGKKMDILAMDACNMAMLEVGIEAKKSVNYLVASEEAEPATGWNYEFVLEPFQTKDLEVEEFAKHIVAAYKKEYEYSCSEHTQSAIKLTDLYVLERNLDAVSKCLLKLLKGEDKFTIFKEIKKLRRSRKHTTCFANKNYIDIRHFYESLIYKTTKIKNQIKNLEILSQLITFLKVGIEIIDNQIIANVTCENLEKACGMAIYYPQRKIHKSYAKTELAIKKNSWIKFLQKYTREQGSIKA